MLPKGKIEERAVDLKKEYASPKLAKFGQVRELTTGGTKGFTETTNQGMVGDPKRKL